MYRCDWCGSTFDEPYAKTVTENLDGESGWWTHTEEFCPHCGSQDYEELEESEDADEDIDGEHEP